MSMGSYLESIGIVGWNTLEPAIFAALKTGTPINLIGDKGTAKTSVASLISKALQGKTCKFQKYDTPDVTMDAVLGLLDLESMKTGKVEFCHTGTSIWNKTAVLWDEINRAGPMIQGKLLEAVRTQTIHGLPTDVKFTFATCNPPRKTQNSVGHDVYYLADAMAGRFFHVPVPGSSVFLFDSAAKTLPIRESIESMNTDAGKYTSEIAKMWLEYSARKPTQMQLDNAHTIVRDVMEHINGTPKQTTNLGGYFDMRAALRSRSMIAELLLLHSMERIINLVDSIAMCVVGNIAELNGIIRNDKSNDATSIKAKIQESVKKLPSTSMSEKSSTSKVALLSMTFKMAQSGTFDEVNIAAMHDALAPTIDSINEALGGLTRRQPSTNDRYRSQQYRSGHTHAIKTVLEYALKNLPHDEKISVMLPVSKNEFVVFLDRQNNQLVSLSGQTYYITPDKASAWLHSQWYKDCGFQGN